MAELTHFDRKKIIVLYQLKDNLNIIFVDCRRLLHSIVLVTSLVPPAVESSIPLEAGSVHKMAPSVMLMCSAPSSKNLYFPVCQ